jgi:hypothetical protein
MPPVPTGHKSDSRATGYRSDRQTRFTRPILNDGCRIIRTERRNTFGREEMERIIDERKLFSAPHAS